MFLLVAAGQNEMTFDELPVEGEYASAATFGLMGLSMLFTFGSPVVASIQNSIVRESGRSASVKIIEVKDTRMTINEAPVVRLTLEVFPDTGAPFEAQTETVISRVDIPQFQPGTMVRVKFDPRS